MQLSYDPFGSSVGRSVCLISQDGGKLHFPALIGAIVSSSFIGALVSSTSNVSLLVFFPKGTRYKLESKPSTFREAAFELDDNRLKKAEG